MLDTDEFLNENWPGLSDRLFAVRSKVPKGAKDRDSMFEQLVSPGLGMLYRDGYHFAGDVLALRFLEHPDPNDTNSGLMYPMLYCYRHFIEISLKALIQVCSKLSGTRIADSLNLTNEHSLARLWNEANRLSHEAFPPHPNDATTDKAVESLINEFNQIDPDSQTFRYDTDKSGKSVIKKLPEVDLQQLITTMAKLKTFFDGCEMYADHLIDLSNEELYP